MSRHIPILRAFARNNNLFYLCNDIIKSNNSSILSINSRATITVVFLTWIKVAYSEYALAISAKAASGAGRSSKLEAREADRKGAVFASFFIKDANYKPI